MFTNTHYLTSENAIKIKEGEDSAMHRDTSINFGYDKSIQLLEKYAGIECTNGQQMAIGEGYDHIPIIDNNVVMQGPTTKHANNSLSSYLNALTTLDNSSN